MSLIRKLPAIVDESRAKLENAKGGQFFEVESFGTGDNLLALGDNLSFMSYLAEKKNLRGRLQMIYSDPPFFSRSKYSATVNIRSKECPELRSIKVPAYDDIWTHEIEEYLRMLCVRLFYMRELLADDGLIWLHLDWHAVHYVRVMMDEIFGRDQFVNEIIWQYKSGGSSRKRFSRKHDTILLYSKSGKYKFNGGKEKSYNRQGKPYGFKGVEEFHDEGGWYTMVNEKDVWQIDMVGRTSGERTGYATQKPLALLRKIIQSSTDPGHLCADFFCGSGTLAEAASEMGRGWICCDLGKLAVATTEKRVLGKEYSLLIEKDMDMEKLSMSEGVEEVKKLMEVDPESAILYKTKKRIVDLLGNMIYS